MQKIKKVLARSKLNIPLPDEITKTDREIAYRRQFENGIAKDEAIPTSEKIDCQVGTPSITIRKHQFRR
ncbi:hypothetical protein AB3S75_032264 [Citrus x aurantiifolia]